ncbi:hypothetical protein [Nostoc sp. CCY 9925]|uniref:hypothetical protein n=1 Tax=Nostoc sp. CCY 9925 TaxID=3103865 RepID=UPI0039C68348
MTTPAMPITQVNQERSKQPALESQETTLAATDKDLLILAEKFLEFEIPATVFLQAMAIGAYDCAAAFRYTDNYLNNLKNKNQHQNLFWLESLTAFENN